jgi:hypothetical protein
MHLWDLVGITSCKILVILSIFKKLEFFERFLIVTKIPSMGDELLHTRGRMDGQTDRHHEAFAILSTLELFGIQSALSSTSGPGGFST